VHHLCTGRSRRSQSFGWAGHSCPFQELWASRAAGRTRTNKKHRTAQFHLKPVPRLAARSEILNKAVGEALGAMQRSHRIKLRPLDSVRQYRHQYLLCRPRTLHMGDDDAWLRWRRLSWRIAGRTRIKVSRSLRPDRTNSRRMTESRLRAAFCFGRVSWTSDIGRCNASLPSRRCG
jgi:hypothetical protein